MRICIAADPGGFDLKVQLISKGTLQASTCFGTP